MLHYAVSHCNFPIVNLIIDSGVSDVNLQNNAGYTPIMLAALADVQSADDRKAIQSLLSKGNVNLAASQVRQIINIIIHTSTYWWYNIIIEIRHRYQIGIIIIRSWRNDALSIYSKSTQNRHNIAIVIISLSIKYRKSWCALIKVITVHSQSVLHSI